MNHASRAVLAVLAAAAAGVGPALTAAAAGPTPAAARHFPNCTAMHRVYKGGVARPGAHDKRAHGGHARYQPKVSLSLYNANKSSDRDHDGIACEQ